MSIYVCICTKCTYYVGSTCVSAEKYIDLDRALRLSGSHSSEPTYPPSLTMPLCVQHDMENTNTSKSRGLKQKAV